MWRVMMTPPHFWQLMPAPSFLYNLSRQRSQQNIISSFWQSLLNIAKATAVAEAGHPYREGVPAWQTYRLQKLPILTSTNENSTPAGPRVQNSQKSYHRTPGQGSKWHHVADYLCTDAKTDGYIKILNTCCLVCGSKSNETPSPQLYAQGFPSPAHLWASDG